MDNTEYTSRTQKKKQAQELQQLGLALNRLSVQQLKNINIPENLKTALIEGKTIMSNIAGRRHRQYIGVLMREVDPDIVRLALLQAKEDTLPESKEVAETKKWMDRLAAGDPADMENFLKAHPGIERQRLRQLIRNIQKNKGESKSSRSQKALEQLIRTAVGT